MTFRPKKAHGRPPVRHGHGRTREVWLWVQSYLPWHHQISNLALNMHLLLLHCMHIACFFFHFQTCCCLVFAIFCLFVIFVLREKGRVIDAKNGENNEKVGQMERALAKKKAERPHEEGGRVNVKSKLRNFMGRREKQDSILRQKIQTLKRRLVFIEIF